jgi:hypothetical protein
MRTKSLDLDAVSIEMSMTLSYHLCELKRKSEDTIPLLVIHPHGNMFLAQHVDPDPLLLN